jgi:hypothetical protein
LDGRGQLSSESDFSVIIGRWHVFLSKIFYIRRRELPAVRLFAYDLAFEIDSATGTELTLKVHLHT